MSQALALGIDLGGTQLRVAVVDGHGRVLRREAVRTDVNGGPLHIIAQMQRLADDLAASDWKDIAAIGVCAPGPLDSEQGQVIDIPTLPGWQNFPLRRALEEKFSRPAAIENDGIAAAYGEWKFGAGQGLDHLVYVTVSTGIGGGVVADGRLLRGRRGMAGHVGHMMIAENGPRCLCGGSGCFEVLASGSALNLAARAKGFDGAQAAVAAARGGDAVALAVLDREADVLGYGFASLLHLYSPQRMIVGGGVSQALDLMLPRIRAGIERHAMPPFRAVEIVTAALGDNAGLAGAASLALSQNYRA